MKKNKKQSEVKCASVNPTKKVSALLLGAAVALCLMGANPAAAQAPAALAPVYLGSAANFAVLAGSTVTNTGPTIINGDLGVWPGTAVTGFYPPGEVNGTIHALGDTAAQQAQASLAIAYNDAAGLTVGVV